MLKKQWKSESDTNACKLEDLDNRLWHNNIRLVGLPEHSEGTNPTEFVETCVWQTIGKDYFFYDFLDLKITST